MLTVENIKLNAELSTLTEAQINVIASMSKTDENEVVGKALSKAHGMYEADIKLGIGLEKPADWKSKNGTTHTYEWLREEVLPNQKQKVVDLQAELATAKSENSTLATQLKDGKIDEATKNKIAKLEQTILDNETLMKSSKEDYEKKLATSGQSLKEEQVRNVDYKFDSIYGIALGDVTVTAGTDDAIKKTMIGAAKLQTRSLGDPEFTDNGDVQFRKDGVLVTDPNNAGQAWLGSNAFKHFLAPISDKKRVQTGAGGRSENVDEKTILDMAHAKDRMEADEIIEKHLLDEGKSVGTKEYQEDFNKLRKEHNVADMADPVNLY